MTRSAYEKITEICYILEEFPNRLSSQKLLVDNRSLTKF